MRKIQYWFIVLFAWCASGVGTADAQSAEAKVCKAAPVDNGKALINPDMGWTMHFYSNLLSNYGSKLEASDVLDYFPGVSTVYLRIPWAFVEPEEGVFNWEVLDTPAQRWIQQGKKVAFRITSTENWMHSGTPEWVYKAGARYYKVDNYLEPDYEDPIFLQKLENFLDKMAQRYDNNPNVAFIDIGHYGMWGEGHTVMTTPKHGRDWGIEAQKKYIDLYCKYFKHVQLCISDDYAGHNKRGRHFPIMDYALSKGVTMRDDSIIVQPEPNNWYHDEMAQSFWPIMPVILEHEHYGASLKRKAWSKKLLLQSVEDYHASYMSIHWWPDIEYKENKDVIEQINLRLGYRLQLAGLEWPEVIRKNQEFAIRSSWKNAGVAPCYPGGYPCFTIKDSKGGVVSVLVDSKLDVKTLPVAAPGKAQAKSLNSTFVVARKFKNGDSFFTRTCKPGEYDLYFSIGQLDGTPVFELPYNDSDSHKRYKIGKIRIVD